MILQKILTPFISCFTMKPIAVWVIGFDPSERGCFFLILFLFLAPKQLSLLASTYLESGSLWMDSNNPAVEWKVSAPLLKKALVHFC